MNSPAPVKIFLAISILVVVSSVSYGINLIGSPRGQRTLKFDERRVSRLTSISFGVGAYWEQNGRLPEQLTDMQGRRSFIRSANDPETGEPYEYRVLSEKGYEICAVFNTDSATLGREFPSSLSERVWEHSADRVCFGLEAEVINEYRRGVPPAPVRP